MSLIAHLPLNNDGNDLLNKYNGNPNSNITWANGKIGRCAEFNGQNSLIIFGLGQDIFPLPIFSFAIWFKSFGTTATSGTSPALWGFTYGCRLLVYSNRLRFGLDNGSTFIYLDSPSTYDFYNDNEWHHVAACADAGNMYLYIDGLLVNTRTTTWLGYTRWMTNSANLGRDNNNSNYYFRGLMDDFRMYDHVLSEKEVQDLAKGLAAHYSFNRQAEYVENIAYTPNGSVDISFQNLSTSGLSTTLQSDGNSYLIEVNNGGQFRMRFDESRLVNGQPYNFSFKYQILTGDSFDASDFCDVSFTDKTNDGSYFSGWASRSTYNSTYRFSDLSISANTKVLIYDIQLENRRFPTKFYPGIREDFVSDNTANVPKYALNKDAPQWFYDGVLGGCYRFNKETYINTGQPFRFEKEDSFSGSFWIKIDDHSMEPGAAAGIFGKGHWYSNTWDIYLQNNHQIRFEMSGNATRNGYTKANTPVLTLDQWYHYAFTYSNGSVKVYLDGVLVSSATYSGTGGFTNGNYVRIGQRHTDSSRALGGSMSDVRLYATELSADDVQNIYKTGLAVDNQGRMHSNYLKESGIINPNILDYTTWTIGSTGSQPGFNRNGDELENYIIEDLDPFDKPSPIWEARPTSTSGADGGWNGSYFPIDDKKMYRFSVWIRRTVRGNGSAYFGLNGGTLTRRDTGGGTTNPYFWSGGWGFPDGEWVLLVGYAWPSGSGTGADHPDSGIYTVSGGRVGNIRNDFVIPSGRTSLRHRSYLYYSTNTSTRQQFAYPRVDVVDGTEPSINALLAGFDSINSDRIAELGGSDKPDNFGVEYGETKAGQFSEVGVANNLVLWLPLESDTKDRINNVIANNSGAVITSDGYRFDPSGGIDYLDLPNDVGYVDRFSAFAFCKVLGAPLGNYHIIFGDTNLELTINTGNFLRSGVQTSSGRQVSNHTPNLNLLDGEWHHVGFTFDGSTKTAYVDGVNIGTMTGITGTLVNSFSNRRIGRFGGSGTYAMNGLIKNAKIFSEPLTDEQVAQEYAHGKALINKNTAYAKEFIEV